MNIPIKSIKDLSLLTIEDLIRLPYFYQLKRMDIKPKEGDLTPHWEVTFMCNKVTETGWALFDQPSDTPMITLFRIM